MFHHNIKDFSCPILFNSLSLLEQIAYFVEPSHECLVECLPTCTSEANPPKYVSSIFPILCFSCSAFWYLFFPSCYQTNGFIFICHILVSMYVWLFVVDNMVFSSGFLQWRVECTYHSDTRRHILIWVHTGIIKHERETWGLKVSFQNVKFAYRGASILLFDTSSSTAIQTITIHKEDNNASRHDIEAVCQFMYLNF